MVYYMCYTVNKYNSLNIKILSLSTYQFFCHKRSLLQKGVLTKKKKKIPQNIHHVQFTENYF